MTFFSLKFKHENFYNFAFSQLARKAVLKNEYDLVKEEFETIGDILNELPDFCPNVIEHSLEN